MIRQVSIRLLGPFEVNVDGAPITGFAYAKVRALLAYLAAERRPHPRAELAALLWPDQPERMARASLSQALTTLRNALDDKNPDQPLLLADAQRVQLDPAAPIQVDVAQLLARLRAADAHAHHSWRTCPACAEQLGQALGFYRGAFLADLPIADSEVFEEWALLQREHLQQRMLSALERLTERAQWRGAYQEALAYAQRLVALEPLLEVHQRTYMRLLAANGELMAALAQARQLRTTLAKELGVEPEDATLALIEQIRRNDTAGLVPRSAPFAVPTPPTALVSRAAELRAICAHMRDMRSRALTITGAGGIGKTRLALEAAHALRYDFEDGVYFVELAALDDAALVADEIALALGVQERPRQSIGAALREHLRAKQMLLVLDNFEHVIAAASLVSELLAACPALTILATSRVALHIRAEQQCTLEPLAEADAVLLFMQRALAAGADLSVGEDDLAIYSAICRRLDQLPLAIELIAVRARTLAPPEMLRQLERPLHALTHGPRDLPARHQALRNAIQWSFDLLDAEEQCVFVCLSVFAGGCTAEAAQAVLGPSIATRPVLERLHTASLLRQQTVAGTTRVFMLETIREFALERLKAQADTSPQPVPHDASYLRVQQRHAEFFLALLEQAVPELAGARRTHWTQQLQAELANMRAALQMLIEAQDGPRALRLVAMLWHYWSDQGFLNEARDWLDRALALALASDEAALSTAHHEALLGAAFMAFVQDDYARARERYEQLLALGQRSGQQSYIAKALDGLGIVVQCTGHLSESRELLEQSIAASHATSDYQGEHRTAFSLAFVRAQQGDAEAARALFEQAVAFSRSSGNASGLGNVLAYYAYALAHNGDYHDARPLAEEALAISMREDLPWMQQIALHTLGLLAFQHEDHATARELFERALLQSQRLGDRLYTAVGLGHLSQIDLREHDWKRAYARLTEGLQLARAISSPKAIILIFEGLANLWAHLGDWERAGQLFGAIEMLYRRRGALPAPLNYELQLPFVQATRAQLGGQRFALAWANGQQLDLEAACILAAAPGALPASSPPEENALALGAAANSVLA